ncbi:MAG TPA: YceI family protein [Acidimicrobiia bacterium]|nr:YceI family protein [Acidimicrobiia bacterium]
MTTYRIDPSASKVDVAATSTLHGIDGRADGVAGSVEIDEDGVLAGAHVEVDAARLGWGNPLLDRETRRRINVRDHPAISGRVLSVESAADGMQVRGTIGFLGVENEVTGTVSVVTASSGRVVIEGEQSFDVRDWGLAPPNLLLIRVDPMIRVRIHVEAVADTG